MSKGAKVVLVIVLFVLAGLIAWWRMPKPLPPPTPGAGPMLPGMPVPGRPGDPGMPIAPPPAQ